MSQVVDEVGSTREPDDLRPRVIGYAALGSAMASFDRWVANGDEDLLTLLDAAFVALAAGFADDAD